MNGQHSTILTAPAEPVGQVTENEPRQHRAPGDVDGRTGRPAVVFHHIEHRPGGLWEVEADVGAKPGRFLFDVDHEDAGDRYPSGHLRPTPPSVEYVDARLVEATEVDQDGNAVGCLPLTYAERHALRRAVEHELLDLVQREVTARWDGACEQEAGHAG